MLWLCKGRRGHTHRTWTWTCNRPPAGLLNVACRSSVQAESGSLESSASSCSESAVLRAVPCFRSASSPSSLTIVSVELTISSSSFMPVSLRSATFMSLERKTTAAVSPAFIATTRRISTPIAIAAFVANRRVFFSFMKSVAIARTSSRESFPSPSRSYVCSSFVESEPNRAETRIPSDATLPDVWRPWLDGGGSISSISTSLELVAGGSEPPPRPRDLSSIVLPEATPLSANVPYIGRLPK